MLNNTHTYTHIHAHKQSGEGSSPSFWQHYTLTCTKGVNNGVVTQGLPLQRAHHGFSASVQPGAASIHSKILLKYSMTGSLLAKWDYRYTQVQGLDHCMDFQQYPPNECFHLRLPGTQTYSDAVVLKSRQYEFWCASTKKETVYFLLNVLWLHQHVCAQDSVIRNRQNTINPKQLVNSCSSAVCPASTCTFLW